MAINGGLWRRLRAFVQSARAEQDLDDELTFHLEMQARKHREHGAGPLDANRRARAQFGSSAFVKDQCRDARGLVWLDTFVQDVKFAVRSVRTRRALALTNIGLIAVSIAFACSAYALLDAVLLRTLPVPHPEELVVVRGAGNHMTTAPLLQSISQDHDHVAGTFGFRSFGGLLLTVHGESRSGRGLGVAGEFFSVLGPPHLLRGTAFNPEAAEPVCIISDVLWREVFGNSSSAVGQALAIGPKALTIAGVAAPDTLGVFPDLHWDVILPFQVANAASTSSGVPSVTQPLETGVRLRHGTSPAAYQAHLATLWPALLRSTTPAGFTLDAWTARQGTTVDVQPMSHGVSYSLVTNPGIDRALKGAMALSLLAFLAGCLAVALLGVSRGVRNRREAGLMLALGGTKSRILRPLILEQLFVSTIGCAAGLVLASWIIEFGRSFLDGDWRVGLSAIVIAAAFAMGAITAVTGSVAVGVTSLTARRLELWKSGSVTQAHVGLRTGLLGLQLALSVALAYFAITFVADLRNLARVDVGLDVDHLHIFSLNGRPPIHDVPPGYFASLDASLKALPGVASAGMSVGSSPLENLSDNSRAVDGDNGIHASAMVLAIYPDAFDVWGVPLLAGRTIDIDDPNTAVITEELARNLYGTPEKALLHTVRGSGSPAFEVQVVGVVRGMSYRGPRRGHIPAIFTSYRRGRDTFASSLGWKVYIRSDRQLADIAHDVTRTVNNSGTYFVYSMNDESELAALATREERLLADASTVFGTLLLGLVAVGLYAFCSYLLALRNRELAIRASLGAGPSRIARELLRETARVVAVGVIAGGALTFILRRVLATFIGRVEPIAIVNVLELLTIVGVIVGASLVLPTMRAVRLDLARALRTE